MTSERDRFWSKVEMGAPHECWEWQAGTQSDGYGSFQHGDATTTAHRVAYELTHGPPEDLVLHHCDNRTCVNPAHLYDGTHSDNAQDRSNRNRRDIAGERNPNAELSAVEVEQIRAKYPGPTQAELAEEYGVAEVTIWSIVNNERW